MVYLHASLHAQDMADMVCSLMLSGDAVVDGKTVSYVQLHVALEKV